MLTDTSQSALIGVEERRPAGTAVIVIRSHPSVRGPDRGRPAGAFGAHAGETRTGGTAGALSPQQRSASSLDRASDAASPSRAARRTGAASVRGRGAAPARRANRPSLQHAGTARL